MIITGASLGVGPEAEEGRHEPEEAWEAGVPRHHVAQALHHVEAREHRSTVREALEHTDAAVVDVEGARDVADGALPRLVRSAYHLLGLRTFLTTGDKESRAWTFRAGAKAPECAGVIHSDLQRGFIRAEVIRWDELLDIGSWNRAKELGKLRVEGKDYEVVDGDVLEIRFNV